MISLIKVELSESEKEVSSTDIDSTIEETTSVIIPSDSGKDTDGAKDINTLSSLKEMLQSSY